MGFCFRVGLEGEVEVVLSEKTFRRMRERVKAMTPRSWGRSVEDLCRYLGSYLRGWMGYFRHCDTAALRSFHTQDAHIRRRIRAIILRQKGRRPRFLFRHLRARNVSVGLAARTAWVSRGKWNRSNRPGMTRAYPNAWFHERLVSLATEWHRHNPPKLASGQRFLFDP